jgi:hypothetical protein
LNEGGLRVDSKEAQGLFNKTATAEGVSSNLGRRIWIRRFGPNLVRTVRSARRGSGQVRSGSDRSDLTERGRRRGGRRRSVFAAARHRSWAKSMLQGSNRTGLGSVAISVTRAIHLRHLWASGLFGIAQTAAEAGLRGGGHRRAAFRLRKWAKVHDI